MRNQKQCANSNCTKLINSYNKFCSNECFQYNRNRQFEVTYPDRVIKGIKKFVKEYGRIPFKREMYCLYRPARIAFGTWNNAIRAAGFRPNKLKFTRKYIANDSHVCDSLTEKVIDDWLYARKIKHEINVAYPNGNGFTVDFKVNNYWIEFFGLSGQHKRYDQLKKQKLRLAKKQDLKVIEIYPHNIFPKCQLDQILGFLITSKT